MNELYSNVYELAYANGLLTASNARLKRQVFGQGALIIGLAYVVCVEFKLLVEKHKQLKRTAKKTTEAE